MDENKIKSLILCSLASILITIHKKRPKNCVREKIRQKRRFWVRDIYLKRESQGLFNNLLAEIKISHPSLFFNFTRMTSSCFELLLSLCASHLQKTSRREAIKPAVRLMVTLRFLATGDSYPSLGYAFRIHPSTICYIIRETCNILWDVLSPIHLKPLSKEEWLKVAEDYYIWQFPNCLGSIDGKHIRVRAPSNSGSKFFNYKKYFSTILLAVCDAKYNFIFVDIGSYGAQSDGGILKNSTFGKNLSAGTLDIPRSKTLPHTADEVPTFFIGDEAFPLQINLMRPYSKRRNQQMPEDEKIFNYRLSRARRTIENTLGIMVARFRIFHREINASPETVDAIVKAVVCLHNFIRSREKDTSIYCDGNYADREVNGNFISGQWRNELPIFNALQNPQIRFGNRNAPRDAWNLRNFIKEYVNNTGSQICPWQFEYVRRTR